MDKLFIQIDDVVREMTDEEYINYLAMETNETAAADTASD